MKRLAIILVLSLISNLVMYRALVNQVQLFDELNRAAQIYFDLLTKCQAPKK